MNKRTKNHMAKTNIDKIENAIRQTRELAEHHESPKCRDWLMRELHAEIALDYREMEAKLEADLVQAKRENHEHDGHSDCF